MNPASQREVVLIHSSDLHLSADPIFGSSCSSDKLSVLREVLAAAAAHGHYVEEPERPGRLLGSWLIRREELIATGADYVALGHWNRAARVGDERIHAYYSGSPDYAGTVNVVRLRPGGAVEVTQAPLRAGIVVRVSEKEE